MPYKAEYIWIDGTLPTAKMRSKTKVLSDGADPDIWGFDGSSTQKATGNNSDVVLNHVLVLPYPHRRGHHKLVILAPPLPRLPRPPRNTSPAVAADMPTASSPTPACSRKPAK